MLAAVLACGAGTVVSHRSAGVLLGLLDRGPVAIDVISAGQWGQKISGIRPHYVPYPAREEIGICNAIPCTSPSRTLVDLAGVLGWGPLRRAVERAAMLRMLDLPAIDAILAGPRRRGSRRLREILMDWRALPSDVRLRSPLEARLLARLAKRDLPIPLCNEKLQVGGRCIEVDFLWLPQRVVVETDGRASHDTVAAFKEDRRRDRDLRLAGYDMLRVTWDQLENEPEVTLATISKLLRAASSTRSAAAA
jgi:very-short-patch-repair endonuclease